MVETFSLNVLKAYLLAYSHFWAVTQIFHRLKRCSPWKRDFKVRGIFPNQIRRMPQIEHTFKVVTFLGACVSKAEVTELFSFRVPTKRIASALCISISASCKSAVRFGSVSWTVAASRIDPHFPECFSVPSKLLSLGSLANGGTMKGTCVS